MSYGHISFLLFIFQASSRFFFFLFSLPEHAQGELLELCGVRLMCGRPRHPSVNFFLVYTLEGSFDWIYMKLCKKVNLYEI